jgi:hypothetical protein
MTDEQQMAWMTAVIETLSAVESVRLEAAAAVEELAG